MVKVGWRVCRRVHLRDEHQQNVKMVETITGLNRRYGGKTISIRDPL